MSKHTPVAPVVRVDNTDIPVIAYQNQRVITTDLMAQVYGTDTKHIQNNFIRNQDRFEQGKHYFKLEGDELSNFKLPSPQINKRTRHLFIWTERGAARHAKMLDTDQAWNVFDKLEEAYFEPVQPENHTGQLPPGALDDPAYLKAAREDLCHYVDDCLAAIKSVGATAPEFPLFKDGHIAGLIAERLMSARVLAYFDGDMQLKLHQVPRDACVISPSDPKAVANFLRQWVPATPEMLSAISSAYITKLMTCQDAAIKQLEK